MSEAHKHNLNRNRVQLMKNVHCLPGVFEFLRQDYTLTEEMQEEIQVTLDYYSSLMFCVSVGLLSNVKSMQHDAARLVTGAKIRDHITPVLSQLYWLPVHQRVKFKIACLVCQLLSG